MSQKYSYPWYIQQFEDAKVQAEDFILSVDDTQFLQPPAEGKWSIAECYAHLIKYEDVYLENMVAGIANADAVTDDLRQPFRPRWIVRKIASFLEPPYKMKLKTVDAMRPEPVSADYDRMEVLDKFTNLQDRLVAQLEQAEHQHVHLGKIKVSHPLFGMIKMTLSECFALFEVHQRRHQWQAKQTLELLGK